MAQISISMNQGSFTCTYNILSLTIRSLAACLTVQQHPSNMANATWLKAVINNSLVLTTNSQHHFKVLCSM